MKDAAFQCYAALYKARLLNDHLLPLTHDWNHNDVDSEQPVETTILGTQVQPFAQMAKAWADPELHQTIVTIRCSRTHEELSMKLTTPRRLPDIPDTSLYWDLSTTFDASFRPQTRSFASVSVLEELRAAAQLLDRSTHSDQSPSHKTDFVLLFSPDIVDDDLRDSLRAHKGRTDMLAALSSGVRNFQGLIRSTRSSGAPFLFSGVPYELAQEDDPEVMCTPLFKRRNFEAPNTLADRFNAAPTAHSVPTPAAIRLRASDCTVDLLDYKFARFNLFVPSLLRHIEALTVATQLQETILQNVRFRDPIHIVTAISAPSAGRATNYQRFEFFGDALLKFQTSFQLFVDHGNWPEGYLSQRKDSIVSNVRLARAAVTTGLDCYVLTDPHWRKWSAPRISDAYQQGDERRLSRKTLADVVEALVGAAYMDSGFEAARACSNVFLPEISALMPLIPQPVLRQTKTPEELEVETMIGYRFRDASLLREALTHPSCGVDASTESYQRLEFLGDAVLDVLISTHLSRCLPESSQGQMTRIKAALANRNLLGYLCLRCGMDRTLIRVETGPAYNLQEVRYHERVSLWRFMRHHSLEVAHAQERVVQSYSLYGDEIHTCLTEGAAYPWRLLARLDLDKFHSDIVESIFGAMFIDSGGHLSACEDFFERIGLKLYAVRMAEGSVHVAHPRDELQRLIGSSKINLNVEMMKLSAERPAFRCIVIVDEEKIVEAQECVTKEEAYMEGAQAAVKFLRSEQGGILI
ncbi:Dicer-like protein 2 [Didymella heteroderae]|uniref:Dicer-like protein 2 n=1 Tax=Didymella heteroderae TaxID=1769908 RepID=A0A9P4WHC5_9PLEO|nr:Dicer-like protein 2 [Didymella heteroderae]